VCTPAEGLEASHQRRIVLPRMSRMDADNRPIEHQDPISHLKPET